MTEVRLAFTALARFTVRLALAAALVLGGGVGLAIGPVETPYPDFDIAGGIAVGLAQGQPPRAGSPAGLSRLRQAAGDSLRVAYNGRTGAPRSLTARRPLSGPHAGSIEEAARGFLTTHRQVWGFAAEEIARMELRAGYTDAHNGVTHVYLMQTVSGLPVFSGVLGLHADPAGRFLAVQGDAYPRLAPPPAATLLPERAAELAAASVGVAYEPVRVDQSGGTVVLAAGPLLADVRVERWVYPLLGTSRLAYRMLIDKNGLEWYDILVDADSGQILHRRNLYQFTGTIAPSNNPEPAPAAPRGRVFVEHGLSTVRGTGDLPRKHPFTADPTGRPRGLANAPLFGADARSVVPHGGNPANATLAQVTLPFPDSIAPLRSSSLPLSTSPQSPDGWFLPLGGDLVTFGNNVDAKEDHAADNESSTGQRANGGVNGDFTGPTFVFQNHYAQNGPYPGEGTLQPASAARKAGAAPDLDPATVSAFYMTNWYHDFLYHLGFTEAAGNFQNDNFGRGGADGDLVYADVQDGSGTNNANFGTPPDGSSPRMQMFLFSGPERDGDFDVDLVIHEYSHGLSNRLVGGPNDTDCLGTPLVGESGGMGEGWGDWYAAVIADEPAVAEYAFGNTQNGIRRFPMDRGPADFTYAFLCSGPPSNPSLIACEVHDVGEFWSIVLWETREAMINRHHNRAFPGGPTFATFSATGTPDGNVKNAQGRTYDGSGVPAQTDFQSIENGTFDALFRVTDAMKLAPCNPTVVDMRDALLAADRNLGGGHQDLIWRAFANRGVGLLAASTGGAAAATVESFLVPATVEACEAGGGPLPAPIFNVISNADNEATVTITPNGAAEYVVYRSRAGAGTPVDPVPYVEVARIPGTVFTDTGLDGGTTYHYRVRALRNDDCVSGSIALAVTPSGGTLDCTATPLFQGLRRVLDPGDCEDLLLDWDQGIASCGGTSDLTYNVYRDVDPGFVPGPANRIATGIAGNSFRDTPGSNDTLFYYVVRAEDGTNGHGGPANGGNEDPNGIVRSGLVTSGTLANQGFADDVEDGPDNGRSARFSSSGLLVPTTPERGGWFRDDSPSPVTPRSSETVWHVFNPDNPTFSPTDSTLFELRSDVISITPESILTFWHTFATEGGFDGGVVEVATVLDATTGVVGPFQDLDSLIYEGGYNGVLDATIEGVINNNPLANRRAYTGGILGQMSRVRAFLGALVPGGETDAEIVIRFLFGNDVANTADPSPEGGFLPGWYIDDVSIDESCCPLSSAPGSLVAIAGNNDISLQWQAPAGTISEYRILREASNESQPAVFRNLIATVPGTATGFVDTGVSGGIVYHYVVRAVPDGDCPSGDSNVASASPLDPDCLVPPTFDGIRTVTAPPGATCGLQLDWDPAASGCPGASVRYNVYRSGDPGFVPGPTDLLVAGLPGPGYLDQSGLVSGQTHHYVVRAEDGTGGGGGPANGGNEDGNLERKGASPIGELAPGAPFADDAESGVQPGYETFSTRLAGGWAVTPDPTAHSADNAWVALDDQPGAPTLTQKDDRLTLPALNLTSGSVLTFWHNFDFARFPLSSPETAYQSGGVLEISADGSAWVDLGAYVLAGAYNGVVDSDAQSPLAARAAWIGSSDGVLVAGRLDAMTQVTVDLGSAIQSAFGVTTLPGARIRFRLGGTFQALIGGIQGAGWGVDDIAVSGLLEPGTCVTNAGRVPASLRAARISSTSINLTWDPSCSAGAEDYGIYEGSVGLWYSHELVDCSDDGADFTEDVATAPGNRYYLVVPSNVADEGSYGRDSAGAERPAGAATCVAQRVLAPCP